MAYLTLNQAKNQCNIDLDFTDDDNYILDLIDKAELALAIKINDDLANHVTGNDLNKYLLHGIQYLVANWYEYREPVVNINVHVVPYTLDNIIGDFFNYTVA